MDTLVMKKLLDVVGGALVLLVIFAPDMRGSHDPVAGELPNMQFVHCQNAIKLSKEMSTLR